MNYASRVLQAIPSTEPASFYEFLGALGGNAPDRDDKPAWATLFETLRSLEFLELVEIERNTKRHIDTLILTELGAERVREILTTERV